jgi:hypothetical protein
LLVLRHTALFLHRDNTTPAEVLAMRKGLAYLRFECPSVRALDYGTDLLGGSSRLRDVKPWTRTPLWRAEREGPTSSYDAALHLDFDDETGLAAYDDHPAHHEVAEYNATISSGEFTARLDWIYDGPPLIARGHVRHTALFVWQDDAEGTAKADTQTAFAELAGLPGVTRVTVGDNVGKLTTDYDWILDVQCEDLGSAQALVSHPAYAKATELLVDVTKYQWTARITHYMHGF